MTKYFLNPLRFLFACLCLLAALVMCLGIAVRGAVGFLWALVGDFYRESVAALDNRGEAINEQRQPEER